MIMGPRDVNKGWWNVNRGPFNVIMELRNVNMGPWNMKRGRGMWLWDCVM